MPILKATFQKSIRLVFATIVFIFPILIDEAGTQFSTPAETRSRVSQQNNAANKTASTCKLWLVSAKSPVIQLESITPAGIIERKTPGKIAFSLDNLLRIDFPHSQHIPQNAQILRLTNGDRLIVKIREASQEILQAEWHKLPGWSPLKIDLTYLRAIFFSLPEQIEKKRILQRRLFADSQEDELMILTNGDRQRGEFQSLDRSQLTLHNGKVDRAKILGIRFDPRFSRTPMPAASRLIVYLKNGSKVSGTIQASSRKDSIELKTEWDAKLTLPLVSLKAIEFWNKKIVPLSNLKPKSYSFRPFLSSQRSYGKNKNVLGGPLRIRTQESSSGIGMHSHSEITFDLNRRYRSFHTWIGIDDDARGKGDVIFSIKLDGKIAFRSKTINGKMEALRLKAVDVSQAKLMTLIVAYGNAADIGDHANWFGARLVKKN